MSQKNKIELADYTTIKHNPRVKYDLSNNDYCIANAIYHLTSSLGHPKLFDISF